MTLGIESIFFNYAVFSILVIYMIAMVPITRRSFEIKDDYKWNNLALILIILAISIFLIIPYNGNYIIYYPWTFFFVFFTGFWLLVLLIGSRFQNKNQKERSKKDNEYKRNLYHGMSYIYLIAFLFAPLFNLLVISVPPSLMGTEEYIQNSYNLMFVIDPIIGMLSFMVFIFIASFILQIDAELIRLNWPEANYPLKKVICDTCRENEKNIFAAHTLFIASCCLSVILLVFFAPSPSIALYAIYAAISISILADLFAALVGKKLGKHKWGFFPDKSIEGTLAGFIVGFIVGTLFIGVIGGLLGAIVFVITDIIIPKKYSIYDNILNPILISVIFALLMQIPNIIQPIISIQLIGVDIISEPSVNYIPISGFWGSFQCMLFFIILSVTVGLLLTLKYRKKQLKYLFSGKK